MTLEEGLEAHSLSSHHAHNHHYLMDWLEDSIPNFLPTFLNEPYSVSDDMAGYEWWAQQDQNHSSASATAASVPPIATAVAKPEPLPEAPISEIPKKRKLAAKPAASQRRRPAAADNDFEEDCKPVIAGGRKGYGKGSGGSTVCGNGGGSKEVRWAEQLLNPLAAAIDAANLKKVQHLLYVLQELGSPTGDANHRLAFYGLQALTRRLLSSGLSIPGGLAGGSPPPSTCAATEPRLFRSALIKFYEVSAWFAFPNALANAAILQAAAGGRVGPGRIPVLHVVDVGVSHGLQWPTLLEALARRVGVAPGLVRLTVVGLGSGGPFGSAPEGYDFAPQLLRYAKSIDLNLSVERAESVDGVLGRGKEMVVVCVQFRAGRVGSGFWRRVREIEPDLVVVSEMEGVGGGEFGGRAEVVWRFLESTGAAFKGRDCGERRVVEGEAARVLEDEGEEMLGRDRWRERMEGWGFREEGFAEEAMEVGRGLLKKYDGNWEMRVGVGSDASLGLWWKGNPVSFCSLWRPANKITSDVASRKF